MDLAREDSVDRVISGGSDGMIGLLMRDGALLPRGASVNSTVLCRNFN